MEQRDLQLTVTLSLPNGAGTAISTSIDTGSASPLAVQAAEVEYILTTPALTTA